MKIKHLSIAIYGTMLFTLFGFNKSENLQLNSFLRKNNIEYFQDSIIVVNNSKVVSKPYRNCGSNLKDNLDNDFLKTTIQYFKIDNINKKQLSKEIFYRNFLTKTHFLEFVDSDFYKDNFTFSLTFSNIKNYGKCYIGKYYFPNADNSVQKRASVIINVDKNEISIWDFNNVIVLKYGLKCDFNVRGKHTIYKMTYSPKCDRFVNF